jgi:hypothetical protein
MREVQERCYFCEKVVYGGWTWKRMFESYRMCDDCDLKVMRFCENKNKTCLLM